MAHPVFCRLEIDVRQAKREMARLLERMESDEDIHEEVERLLDCGVPVLQVDGPGDFCDGAIIWRGELAEPYWRILEREAA